MKEHELEAGNHPETKLAYDEVAKEAYAIYEREGRPRGHTGQNWSEAEAYRRQQSDRQMGLGSGRTG